jgi:hypothetical protein
MNKYLTKVLNALKPKVKAYGFRRKELESAAATIADNLDLADDASEEDVASAIDEAIDAAIPFFKLAQKSANRSIKKFKDEWKANHEDEDEDDEDDEDDDDENDEDDEPAQKPNRQSRKSSKANKKSKSSKSNDDGDSELKSLLKSLNDKLDSQASEIKALKAGKTADKRLAKISKLVENTGSFGKRTLRAFKKMQFEDDDDFQDYLDEVKEDLDELNQERANAGLEKLGTPPAAPKTNKKGDGDEDDKENVMSDEEIEKFAEDF